MELSTRILLFVAGLVLALLPQIADWKQWRCVRGWVWGAVFSAGLFLVSLGIGGRVDRAALVVAVVWLWMWVSTRPRAAIHP